MQVGGSGGTVYDHQQLMALWVSNGGAPNKADLAAAIAEAESSGNPTATSPNPDGGTNVGLWQLDTKGKGAGHSIAQLENPSTNARLAVSGSGNGSDWSAWSTYGSGAYKSYLSGTASYGAQSNTAPVTSQQTGLAAIGNFFSELGQANVWLRVAEVAIGVVLISVGLAKMTNAVPAATKIAEVVK